MHCTVYSLFYKVINIFHCNDLTIYLFKTISDSQSSDSKQTNKIITNKN